MSFPFRINGILQCFSTMSLFHIIKAIPELQYILGLCFIYITADCFFWKMNRGFIYHCFSIRDLPGGNSIVKSTLFRHHLHCSTGVSSDPQQKLLRIESVYTASMEKKYQIGGARSVTDSSEQCKRRLIRNTFCYGSEVLPIRSCCA